MRTDTLPFARGDSYFGIAGATTISSAQSNMVAGLLGNEYVVTDPDYNNVPVVLKIVQYTSSADLSALRRCVDYVDNLGVSFTDQAPAASEQTHPLDHKLNGKTIKQYDLVYVVVKGPCEVEGGAIVSAGENLSTATDGQLVAAAAGDNFVVGIAVDATTDGGAATVNVGVNRGIE